MIKVLQAMDDTTYDNHLLQQKNNNNIREKLRIFEKNDKKATFCDLAVCERFDLFQKIKNCKFCIFACLILCWMLET